PQTRRSSPMNEASITWSLDVARDGSRRDSLRGFEDIVDVIVRAKGQTGSIAALRVGGALDVGQQVGARLAENCLENRVAIGMALLDEREEYARSVLDPPLLRYDHAAAIIHHLALEDLQDELRIRVL